MSTFLALPCISVSRWGCPITESTQMIGRDKRCSLRIADTSVSRLHARIWRSGERIHLMDLGSTNGTRVNFHKVQRATLSVGDSVQLGCDTIFKVKDGADASQTSCHEQSPTVYRCACVAAVALREFASQPDTVLHREDWLHLYSLSSILQGTCQRRGEYDAIASVASHWLLGSLPITDAIEVRRVDDCWKVTSQFTSSNTPRARFDPQLLKSCHHDNPVVFESQNKTEGWFGRYAIRIPCSRGARILCGNIEQGSTVSIERCRVWLQFISFVCRRLQDHHEHERLSRGQLEILSIIRRTGRRVTTSHILALLDRGRKKSASIGVTKQHLAELVKRGILNNQRPRGYGLPDWD